jgi:rSAM/selenodomain-associated transferase 2
VNVSIVVPAVDEASELPATLRRARDPSVCEVLVVDGGSRDATAEIAAALADRVVPSARGRARQMNAGARAARGEILLFLHADTWLPAGFGSAVVAAVAAGNLGGRFDVTLRGRHPFLPVVAWLMNLRSRLSRIATGDQAMFVRRDVFESLGGFADVPLMEDVLLSTALKRRGPTAALRERVSTSARRWEERGVARTIALMWGLRLAHALGAPPGRLAQWYR